MQLTSKTIAQALGISKRAVDMRAAEESWRFTQQPCRGGQRRLYSLTDLPADVQDTLRTQLIDQALQCAPVCPTPDTAITASTMAVQSQGISITGAHPTRTTPAAADLTQIARETAIARIALIDEIHRLAAICGSVNQAVKKVEELSQRGELPEHLRELAPLANAKSGDRAHLLAFRTLRRWITLDKPNGTPSERIAALAPRTQGVSYAMPGDVGAVLALFRTANKPSLRYCAQAIAREQGADWRTLYDAARRFKAKVPRQVFYGGRNTAAALKALQPFRRREFLSLAPNDVWTGDGHAMKFKIAHPETGAPFVPELTVIMDVGSRYVVGWSLSFSENCIAVSDALRWAVQQHGVPLIYYSDNGGGQKN
jgi:putative transposase